MSLQSYLLCAGLLSLVACQHKAAEIEPEQLEAMKFDLMYLAMAEEAYFADWLSDSFN